MTLLPISIEDLIPKNHVVRVVNSSIDNIDTTALFKKYSGGGSSSYHPVIMLKLEIISCRTGIFQ